MEAKPDLNAEGFSMQNAYFFAKMSKAAYSPREAAEGLVKGNSTCAGMGFDQFYWFEVSGFVQTEEGCSRAS